MATSCLNRRRQGLALDRVFLADLFSIVLYFVSLLSVYRVII